MDNHLLELYSDYLLSSFGATTATGLSALVEGAISHDQVTRFLSAADYDGVPCGSRSSRWYGTSNRTMGCSSSMIRSNPSRIRTKTT